MTDSFSKRWILQKEKKVEVDVRKPFRCTAFNGDFVVEKRALAVRRRRRTIGGKSHQGETHNVGFRGSTARQCNEWLQVGTATPDSIPNSRRITGQSTTTAGTRLE